MAHLLVVILHNTTQLPELITTWQEIGIPGITILGSAGGYRTANWLERVGLGAIGELFSTDDVQSQTLLAVIEDEELLERAIAEAERIIGDFTKPETGILFIVPISRALGIVKRPTEAASPRQLELTDEKIMARDTPVSIIDEFLKLEPVIVPAQQTLLAVAKAMFKVPNVTVACVVNEQGRLVGLLRLQDLVDDLFMVVVPEEFLGETHDLEDALHFAHLSRTHTAEDAMIEPVWVKNEETLRDAFHKMHDNKLAGIPIVNDQYEVTGYINLLELVAAYTGNQETLEE